MTGRLTILILIAADEAALTRIRQVCPAGEVRVGPWIDASGQRLSPELLRGVHVLLCELPPANFDDFDCLQWIQLCSAGYTQVLDLPILERGVRVTNGLGNFDGPIAEWNIMMMLMWQREMLDQQANQRNRVWDRDARFQRDLYGSTIGFWGYGGIARETARLAKAMHLTVWAMTRDGTIRNRHSIYRVEGTGDPEGRLPDRVFRPDQKAEFLGGLDYLILGMALTPYTKGLIGEKDLRMLRSSAVLINPTRAAIIDERALLRCLQERWIRGASLDVHYRTPLPPEHPLWGIPNVILTPHISGSAAAPNFLRRIHDIFGQNLERFVARRPLLNELSAAQLQGR